MNHISCSFSQNIIEYHWGPRTVLHAGDMMVSIIDMRLPKIHILCHILT